MAQIEIPNGASVSRLYSDGSGDLMAVFSYVGDAEKFADLQAQQDIARKYLDSFYVVANLYNGRVKLVSTAKVAAKAEQVSA